MESGEGQLERFTWRNLSHLSILLVGFALAFDFSVVAISIQSYWHVVAPGKESLYGFVFGCYDLTQFVFMPIFGYVSDKVGIRWTVICALIINIVGNIVYSFALYTNSDTSSSSSSLGTYSMIIIGRLIAGIGSSALGLGVVYLTLITTVADRRNSIGIYRISQTLARTIGPFITFSLEGMSFVLQTDEQLIFNFYTIPGWIAVFVALAVLCVFFIFFEEPIITTRSPNKTFSMSQATNLVHNSATLCTIHFIVTFVLMASYSQLFGIAAVEYHIISDASNIYLCYIALGSAAGGAFWVWRKLPNIEDTTFMLGALVMGVVSSLLFIDYGHENNPPPESLFYVASAFLGVAVAWFFANCESFFTKKVTQYSNEAGPHQNFFVAMLPAAGALGRFLGPLIFGFSVTFSQTDPSFCNPNFNYQLAYTSGDSYIEKTLTSFRNRCSLSSICLLMFPQDFLTDGCSLSSITAWMVAMAVLLILVFMYLSFFYLPKHATIEAPAKTPSETALQEQLLTDEAYAKP